MNFTRISIDNVDERFFFGVKFFIWNTYDRDNYFDLFHKNGKIYRLEYSEILKNIFPVIKNFSRTENFCEKWFWHYMEMGGGVVFIHEEIVESYKKYAEIDGDFQIAAPNVEAAKKAVHDFNVLTKKFFDDATDYKKTGWIYLGNNNERYFLGKPGQKNLLIFGINPSTATPEKLDPTIKKICKIINSNRYDGWIMMNIYPQITPHPKELNFDSQIFEKNFEMIELIPEKFCIEDVWCAWGNLIDTAGKKFLRQSLENIIAILKNFDLKYLNYGELTAKKNPRHPLYVSLQDSFRTFDIENYLM